MHKRLLLLLIGLTSFFVEVCMANCSSSKNPSEVNVFLDFNASWREVNVAKEQACKEGKALKVIPDWEDRVHFSKVAEDYVKAELRLNHCQDDECKKKQERIMEVKSQQMSAFKRPMLDKNLLSREMAALEEQYPHLDIGRLVLSGHDGGGNFDGYSGQLSRQEIYDVFKNYPEKRESIQGLYLLGCNSGTTQELALWNNIFPAAIFINGYEGQGPLNFREKGLNYFKSSLETENEIYEARTKEQIVEQLKSIAHIEESYSGIKVNCFGILNDRGEPLEMNAFGMPVDRGSFIRDDPTAGCHDPIFEKKYESFQKYYNGILEIPEDSGASSPVRGLYNFASSKAHCMQYQDEFKIPKNAVFGLNFFHDFKKNALRASETYKKKMLEDGLFDLDSLYDDYIRFLKDREDDRGLNFKVRGLFNSISGGIKELSLEQVWDMVDKIDDELFKFKSNEDEYKQKLVDALKVTAWNNKSGKVESKTILNLFAEDKENSLPSKEEFKSKYGAIVNRFNRKSREFISYIPDSETESLGSGDMLINSSRAEILDDFHKRKKRALDSYWNNHNRTAHLLSNDEDPFMAVIFQKSSALNNRIMKGIDYYQSGVVDLSCVPFNWHEENAQGSSKIGDGNPCTLPSI